MSSVIESLSDIIASSIVYMYENSRERFDRKIASRIDILKEKYDKLKEKSKEALRKSVKQ